jgi:hypothetical protein
MGNPILLLNIVKRSNKGENLGRFIRFFYEAKGSVEF